MIYAGYVQKLQNVASLTIDKASGKNSCCVRHPSVSRCANWMRKTFVAFTFNFPSYRFLLSSILLFTFSHITFYFLPNKFSSDASADSFDAPSSSRQRSGIGCQNRLELVRSREDRRDEKSRRLASAVRMPNFSMKRAVFFDILRQSGKRDCIDPRLSWRCHF